MPDKQFIDAQQLLDDSFSLGLQVLESGFRPDFIVGVWRGGTPVGIAVQELLEYCGVSTNHIAIRTSLYTGIDQRAGHVRVHGLGYVTENIRPGDSLLIVDDVYDTGLSIHQIIHDFEVALGVDTHEIRVATPYFKPANNQSERVPDYYLHETDQWLVFPHELSGLNATEIIARKPGIHALKDKLLEFSGV